MMSNVSTAVKILMTLHDSTLKDELKLYVKPLTKVLKLNQEHVKLVDFKAIADLISELSKELNQRPKPPQRKLLGKCLEEIKSTAESDEPCLLDPVETTEEEEEEAEEPKSQPVGFGPACVDLERGDHDYKAFTALRSILRSAQVEGEITRDDEYLYLTLHMSPLNQRDMDMLGGVLVDSELSKYNWFRHNKEDPFRHTYRFSKCLLEESYDRFQQVKNVSGEVKPPVVLGLGKKKEKTKCALEKALDTQENRKEVKRAHDSDSDSDSDSESDEEESEVEVKKVVVACSPRKLREENHSSFAVLRHLRDLIIRKQQPLPVEGETWLIKTRGREEQAVVASVTAGTVCLGWKNGTEDVLEWIDASNRQRLVRKIQ